MQGMGKMCRDDGPTYRTASGCGHGAPVPPSGNLNLPILEFFDSFCGFARPAPTIGTYNPPRTNDSALAMSSRIMRAIALGSSEEEELMMSQ